MELRKAGKKAVVEEAEEEERSVEMVRLVAEDVSVEASESSFVFGGNVYTDSEVERMNSGEQDFYRELSVVAKSSATCKDQRCC